MIGFPPFRGLPFWVYFSGDWDVHWGYDLDFDPRPAQLGGKGWGGYQANRPELPNPTKSPNPANSGGLGLQVGLGWAGWGGVDMKSSMNGRLEA